MTESLFRSRYPQKRNRSLCAHRFWEWETDERKALVCSNCGKREAGVNPDTGKLRLTVEAIKRLRP